MLQTRSLGSLGGKDLGDCVRGIMAEMFTNELAKKFNWLGRGEKQGFSHLGLHKVLKGLFNLLFFACMV